MIDTARQEVSQKCILQGMHVAEKARVQCNTTACQLHVAWVCFALACLTLSLFMCAHLFLSLHTPPFFYRKHALCLWNSVGFTQTTNSSFLQQFIYTTQQSHCRLDLKIVSFQICNLLLQHTKLCWYTRSI